MAFPIPSHLPRKANAKEVSSSILTKIDEATNRTLTSSLASSWVAELEQTIVSTRERIHERIHVDLPAFERHLESSKSVRTRLQTLTSNVDLLSQALDDPETGLLPTVVKTLTAHANLANEAGDAQAAYDSLFHLSRCRSEYNNVMELVNSGQLPQASGDRALLERLLEDAPSSLKMSKVLGDLKRGFFALKDRTDDQLSDAYSRSVQLTHNSITIRPSVHIRGTESSLTLAEVLSTLSPPSLNNHLITFRRDLGARFIEHVLQNPLEVTVHSPLGLIEVEHVLSYTPSPPNSEDPSIRLQNLSTILNFLQSHFFSKLPPSQREEFPKSLCNIITTAVLNKFLIPLLPSSFKNLPGFLILVRSSVTFENEYVVEKLGNTPDDRPVEVWANGVGGHYERQRRQKILDHSRIIITSPEDHENTFRVEVLLGDDESQVPGVVVTQETPTPISAGQKFEDADERLEEGLEVEIEENGWGFEDDLPPEDSDTTSTSESEKQQSSSLPEINGESEPDPDDAWGWHDGEDDDDDDDEEIPRGSDIPSIPEESAWDDPWDDQPGSPLPIPSKSPIRLQVPPSIPTPNLNSPLKSATRLEKASMKAKKLNATNGHANGHANGNGHVASSPSSPTPSPLREPPANPTPKFVEKRPPNIKTIEKENYLVSNRVRQVMDVVTAALGEGKELTASNLFESSTSTFSPGSLITQSAVSTVDVFRALYPVKFSSGLASSTRWSMRFSNDCLYLSNELAKLSLVDSGPKEKLGECRKRLTVLANSWYYDTIERHRTNILEKLADAEGFFDTTNQDRYDECETAVSGVLRDIREVSYQWKGVLTKSKYYYAVGMLADAALANVLKDMLALADIPELESHRLSELCRILNALEGLFVEEPDQPSFVVSYVPSWLKFSYLSELLEASIADISYLFEEGALVDFEVEELVKLVKALFADTQLRTNTINKLLAGHPIRH